MKITKLHCLGNEYCVLRAGTAHHPLPTLASQGGRLFLGGAKGLLVLCPDSTRYRVELYNSQGARVAPGACAVRCAGYALGQGSWELNTDSGLYHVTVQGNQTGLCFPPPTYGGEYQIGKDYFGYLLSLGQRYFITFQRTIRGMNIQTYGEALDRYFGGANIVFAQEGVTVQVRIWQRGEELSGSSKGAYAVASILQRLGRGQCPILVSMPGGKTTMDYDSQGRLIQLAPVQEAKTK